jgi:photosystem II stability/assembly factor-like uncharacterized protein
MPELSRGSRALSVIAVAVALLAVASVVYLRAGGSSPQPASKRPAAALVGSAQFLSARTGWVAVNDAVLSTSDGGRHWRRILALPNMLPTWIRLFDERTGLVLVSSQRPGARRDRLLRTDDGGAGWTDERLPANDSVIRASSMAAFPDPAHGWYVLGDVAGSGPKDVSVYRTDDGGTNWARIEALDFLHPAEHGLVRGGEPMGLDFADAEKGWLVQASVVVEDAVASMTTDGGASWQAVALPAPPGDSRPLSDMGVPAVFPDGTGLVWAVRGFQDATAYVYRSPDSGRTWGSPVQVQEQSLGVTVFVDPAHWWRAAGTVTVRTSDGGRSWYRGGTAPNGLSFSWLQPVSERIAWAAGVKPDLAAAELLRTDDGGDHWSAVAFETAG